MEVVVWLACGLVASLLMLRHCIKGGKLTAQDLAICAVIVLLGAASLSFVLGMWLCTAGDNVVLWKKEK